MYVCVLPALFFLFSTQPPSECFPVGVSLIPKINFFCPFDPHRKSGKTGVTNCELSKLGGSLSLLIEQRKKECHGMLSPSKCFDGKRVKKRLVDRQSDVERLVTSEELDCFLGCKLFHIYL